MSRRAGEEFQRREQQRAATVAHVLEEGETVEDHGLMRLRGKKRWREGFMVITDRRLLFCDDASGEIGSMPFDAVEAFRGFRRIFTADLFVDIHGGRLRFNGGKTFVFLCCRALTRGAGDLE